MEYLLHLTDLLAKLYRKQLDEDKVAGTLSEWFHVKKGVRQGCVVKCVFLKKSTVGLHVYAALCIRQGCVRFICVLYIDIQKNIMKCMQYDNLHCAVITQADRLRE